MFLIRPHYPKYLPLDFSLIEKIGIRRGFGDRILLKIVFNEPLEYFLEELTLNEFWSLLDYPNQTPARNIVFGLINAIKSNEEFYVTTSGNSV